MNLVKFKESLSKNPAISKIEAAFSEAIVEAELEIFQMEKGFKLSQSLFDLYKQSRSPSLIWYYNDKGAKKIGGEFSITYFLGIFGNSWEGVTWYQGMENDIDQWGKKYMQLSKKLKVLDSYQKAFDGTRFCAFELKKKEKNIEPTIWIWNTKGDKYPLDLDSEKYLEKLQKARAFINWQYFFIDLDEIDFSDQFLRRCIYGDTLDLTLRDMEFFLDTMPNIFPNDDLSEFEERYYIIKKYFETRS